MDLPVDPVILPAALVGQPNGQLPAMLLEPTPGLAGGPTVRLCVVATRSWRAMTAAAAAAAPVGILLKATSLADSYRTLAQQITTFTSRYQLDPLQGRPYRWWDSDGNGVREQWWQKPNTAVAAVPGTSNHGLGLAVDVAGTGSAETPSPILLWLLEHAAAYGWSWETQSEAWHIRYTAGDDTPPAVLAYEGGTDMGAFVLRNFPGQPDSTQGAYHVADASPRGFHVAPREGFNKIAWPGAPELSPLIVPAKYDYEAILRALFGPPRDAGDLDVAVVAAAAHAGAEEGAQHALDGATVTTTIDTPESP